MDKNTVEFYGELEAETNLACKVSDGVNSFWIPKSQIENKRHIKGSDYEFEIPEWLAKEKGVV